MSDERDELKQDTGDDIELSQSQYDYGRDYWQEFADQRATYLKRPVTISIAGVIRYRALPKENPGFRSINKGWS